MQTGSMLHDELEFHLKIVWLLELKKYSVLKSAMKSAQHEMLQGEGWVWATLKQTPTNYVVFLKS